ncbi:hypothetical protein J2S43_007442 [Catenuloplanes nepalensis]|uniref:Uncharacterized protein n=1 Tax=Catenuloplanes nepalensis TaxID=587533 RepID=A0ABT9N5W1_9ACTN|nr:hypothetical protein [Catenuloplanes nepalensis]MDP9798930.1 hypothetical protein [Catenuloplanes nepalensis]
MTRSTGARPGKAVVVIKDLTALHGPTTGTVTLPHHLMWQAADVRTFDLDNPRKLRRLYEVVLREARGDKDLMDWLDGRTLHTHWPSLHLPHGVRHVWELSHPTLSTAREASPDQANPAYGQWLMQRSAA